MIRSNGLEPAYQAEFTNGTHAAVADSPVAKGGGVRASARTNCWRRPWRPA